MARLVLVLASLGILFFYGAGCSTRALNDVSDGGPNDLAALDCESLGEAECNASSCVADYCFACSCTPSFVGCRRPSDPAPECPLYGCPQPLCDCSGLPESACVSQSKTLGCTPMYCPDCNGGQYFTECLPPNAGQGFCPAACPQKGCHNDKECSGGQFCLAPGVHPGCGACEPTGCADDSSCNPGEICDFDPCVCTNSGHGCVPGCASAGCPEGQTCGNSNHCIPTFCQKPNDCPAQFQCDGNSHSCTRKPCLDDTNCPGGFCVENSCYSSLGTCSFPVP